MALLLKQTVRLSEDTTTLYMQDTTGNYSSTNPGGWGTPNFAKSEATGIAFTVSAIGSNTEYFFFTGYDGRLAAYKAGTEIAITATEFGIGAKFPAGQLVVTCIAMMSTTSPGVSTPVSIVVNNSSRTIIVPIESVNQDLRTALIPDAAIMITTMFPESDIWGTVNPLFFVDKTKTYTATTAQLIRETPGTGAAGGWLLFPIIQSSTIVGNNSDLEECVASAIGGLASNPSMCDDDIDRTAFMTLMKFAVDIQTDAGNYQAAGEIRSLLSAMCTPNCGCS